MALLVFRSLVVYEYRWVGQGALLAYRDIGAVFRVVFSKDSLVIDNHIEDHPVFVVLQGERTRCACSVHPSSVGHDVLRRGPDGVTSGYKRGYKRAAGSPARNLPKDSPVRLSNIDRTPPQPAVDAGDEPTRSAVDYRG